MKIVVRRLRVAAAMKQAHTSTHQRHHVLDSSKIVDVPLGAIKRVCSVHPSSKWTARLLMSSKGTESVLPKASCLDVELQPVSNPLPGGVGQGRAAACEIDESAAYKV